MEKTTRRLPAAVPQARTKPPLPNPSDGGPSGLDGFRRASLLLHLPSPPQSVRIRVLRPRKKYTVYDLQQCKGKRCLTHIHVKSPEEAAAAEEAGVDLMSCSFDSPESQARLPRLVAAAPNSFLSAATLHGMASTEEAIRVGFRALEAGASSVYCSASPFIIEAMSREGLPVVGHLGMVPRHVTWTGYRAIGKTEGEARQLYERMKRLENAGAYAAELECVPHQLARFLCSKTKMLL